MVFSDPVFLFAFLPLSLLTYWAVAWRSRNSFLIAVGCVFYLAGAGDSLILLSGTVLINYVLSRMIRKRQDAGGSARLSLMVGVFLNLVISS